MALLVRRKWHSNSVVCKNWEIEITGYITNEDLIYLINNNYILPKNSILNNNTKIDAENYYVQSGDLKDLQILFSELKNK